MFYEKGGSIMNKLTERCDRCEQMGLSKTFVWDADGNERYCPSCIAKEEAQYKRGNISGGPRPPIKNKKRDKKTQ